MSDEELRARGAVFAPLEYRRPEPGEQLRASPGFYELMDRRRTVRHFSPDPLPFELIENAIRTANAAPSGAHQQPWTFVVVRDPGVKRAIREAAEAEEKENYERRFPEDWKNALAKLGTDWRKEFLEVAPYLIVVFKQSYGLEQDPGGTVRRVKHYYADESVGIAVGLLIASLHHAGLATLTHTPNPMAFLSRILERPGNERPYLLLPVGYPVPGCRVPDLRRKPLEEIMVVV